MKKIINYEQIYDITTKFVNTHNIFEYPLDLYKLCNTLDIKILYYTDEFVKISKDGFCVKYNNAYSIFINSTLPKTRQRFTIAHELGHIVLNHHNTSNYDILANNGSNKRLESEANLFARLLLCPAFLTVTLKEDGYKLLGVSKEMYQISKNFIAEDIIGMKDIKKRYSYVGRKTR